MALTPVDHRKYAPDYFSKIETGTAVAGQPGRTWKHTGTGWAMDDGAPVAGAPAPAADGMNKPMVNTAQQAVTGQATVGATPQQGSQTNVAGAFQQALVNKLAPGAVNAQNPAIAGSLQANRLAEQRGFERDRNLLAERAAVGAVPSGSGAFDSQLMGLGQRRNARESAFEGMAVGDLQKSQDAQVMAALGLGGNMLGQQDSLSQSRYGMDLDAQLRREGLGAQTSLGNRDIDLRGELGRGNLNLGLLGLLQGGEQFGQGLGAQLGMFGANRDDQNMRYLLGLL